MSTPHEWRLSGDMPREPRLDNVFVLVGSTSDGLEAVAHEMRGFGVNVPLIGDFTPAEEEEAGSDRGSLRVLARDLTKRHPGAIVRLVRFTRAEVLFEYSDGEEYCP